jgi:hypothetical protein
LIDDITNRLLKGDAVFATGLDSRDSHTAEVHSAVVLSGFTVATFGNAARTGFKAGVAKAVGVAPTNIRIESVKASTGTRRLNSAELNGVHIEFAVSVDRQVVEQRGYNTSSSTLSSAVDFLSSDISSKLDAMRLNPSSYALANMVVFVDAAIKTAGGVVPEGFGMAVVAKPIISSSPKDSTTIINTEDESDALLKKSVGGRIGLGWAILCISLGLTGLLGIVCCYSTFGKEATTNKMIMLQKFNGREHHVQKHQGSGTEGMCRKDSTSNNPIDNSGSSKTKDGTSIASIRLPPHTKTMTMVKLKKQIQVIV